MEETTQQQPKKNRLLLIIKIIGGAALVPILGLLYIIDRVICVPILWRGVYPIQDVFADMRLIVPMLYRIGAVALVVVIWTIARIF